MPSRQFLFAFSEYFKIFKYYSNPSLSWDPLESCLKYRENNATLAWHLNMTIVIGMFFNFASTFVLFLQWLEIGEKVEIKYVVCVFLFLAVSLYASTVYLLISAYGRDFCRGWNALLKLHMRMAPRKCKLLVFIDQCFVIGNPLGS